MIYKSYPTKETVPQRMSRKRSRRDIFEYNRKLFKVGRKARRIERQEKVLQEQTE